MYLILGWERGQVGILGTQESRNLGIQESGNLESKKLPKMKILRMQIRSAKNAGKVLICRRTEETPGPIWGNFRQIFHVPEKCQNCIFFCLFSWVAQQAPFTRFGVMRWVIFEFAGSWQQRSRTMP